MDKPMTVQDIRSTTRTEGAPAPPTLGTLKTGLRVVVREKHQAQVATADIWVGTGSAHETPDVGGISHFLEHMLFKGTERFALGEIEREIENMGGVSNAGTSYDFTHYYLTMPSENIERGIEMLSEMVTHSSLDPDELEKERLVILEEYRRKLDDPGAMLFEDLYEQLYEAGPYHASVIGTEATIRSITREQMADYYRRHYCPENSLLIVTGDVRPDAVLACAEKFFGAYDRPYDPLLPNGPAATRFSGTKTFHHPRPTGGELYYSLACGAPGADRTDLIVPLDVAQYMLGQGRASILYQEIKERRRLASTIACYYSTHRYASAFMVDATCEPSNKEKLREAIDDCLEKFSSEPISSEQFERARRLLASGHLFSLETTGSCSVQTGYYYNLTGDFDFFEDYLDRLNALTPEDVKHAFETLRSDYEWVEVSVGPDGVAAGNNVAGINGVAGEGGVGEGEDLVEGKGVGGEASQ